MSLTLLTTLQQNLENDKNVQKQAAEWLNGIGDDYTHAVTLSLPFLAKDELEADRYVGKFIKFLNKSSNRRAYRNKDKIKVAIVLEGVNSKERIHIHCAIRSPNKFSFDVFSELIKKSWRKAVSNNEAVIDIKQYENNGWIGYCTKQLTTTKTNGISQYCNF